MESDAPIASFHFTLDGFDNVLSANSISPFCLASHYFESLSFVENYFSGGDTDNNPIPAGTGPFLAINANYNSSNLDGQFLTIDEISPGLGNQETHFYTYTEQGDIIEMSYDWVPMTWELGTNNVIPWIGQDCVGDIWGTAFEDDCGVCSEGTTGHEPNSDIDCNGDCFGISMLDDCGVCEGDNSTCINEGCTNPNASNYDETANVDDGSCIFEFDFDYNQSQVQAAYFIDASLGGADLEDGDFIVARFNGIVVGANSVIDLIVMGRDEDIEVDGETYVVCETTGTCDYPEEGDMVHLSIFDASSGIEYTPYLPGGTAQTVTFIPGIDDSDGDGVADITTVSIVYDCSGTLGGSAIFDLCGECGGGNTSCEIITDIDGNEYGTVVIGDQIWMAQNLKVTHYNNGDEVQYSIYNNDSDIGEIYGYLYNWYTASDERNICPENFHVPTNNEWQILSNYLGGNNIAGGKMKTEGTTYWESPNEGATNESGFSALPGGLYSAGINFNSLGTEGNFISSTSEDGMLHYKYINNTSSQLRPGWGSLYTGHSIRCLSDEVIQGCTNPDASNYDETANVDDGSCCIELWGECYNIDETTSLFLGNSEQEGSGIFGEIPPEIGNLINLEYLDLSGSYSIPGELSGYIPSEIGQLTNLRHLNLEDNQLTGEIPSEIGNLINLINLRLGNNQLSGEIPVELVNLQNLTHMYLMHNELIGEIPSGIVELTNLYVLMLNGNQLIGEILPEIGNLTNLEVLYLSENQLTGEIPPEIGDLENLTSLYLYTNQLTGEIPPEIGNLTNLTSLRLDDNQLTGEIPSEIGNLIDLTTLRLRDNQLTGEIPSEIGNLINLTHLSLYDNELTGEIPSEICNLINLTTLYLSGNQLCPPYPDCGEGPITSEVVQDTSECEEYLLGDVNFDGEMNILDMVTGVNMIVGNIPSTNLELYVLDFNQDGSADILDIVAMINYIFEN